ncbi:MAG: GtrA family protein, partial [Candidatus Nanosynbacter sp.]|nr:GtrA family protein [Candidatus Nanosynbacter sp.]
MNEYDILNKDNMKNGIFLKIFLFLVVGGITLLIDTSISYILYHNIHLPAFLASGIGFLSGFVFNFPVNRKKVFNHSQYDRFSL